MRNRTTRHKMAFSSGVTIEVFPHPVLPRYTAVLTKGGDLYQDFGDTPIAALRALRLRYKKAIDPGVRDVLDRIIPDDSLLQRLRGLEKKLRFNYSLPKKIYITPKMSEALKSQGIQLPSSIIYDEIVELPTGAREDSSND